MIHVFFSRMKSILLCVFLPGIKGIYALRIFPRNKIFIICIVITQCLVLIQCVVLTQYLLLTYYLVLHVMCIIHVMCIFPRNKNYLFSVYFSQDARDAILNIPDERDVDWIQINTRPIKLVSTAYAKLIMFTYTQYLSDQVLSTILFASSQVAKYFLGSWYLFD